VSKPVHGSKSSYKGVKRGYAKVSQLNVFNMDTTMRILIVNPPIRLNDKPRHIPHGLAILANIIRRHFKCELGFIDWNAYRYSEEKFRTIVREFPCDVAMIGGLIPTYRYLIQIAEIIKSYHPKCKVIAGGSAAMSIPEILLRNSMVDIVCTGEGEITITELIPALQQQEAVDLSQIRGIAYKDIDNRISINEPRPFIRDLDTESALPAYDLLPMDIYLANPVVGLGRDIDFISGRGCPFKCTFCYQPWGRTSRQHSAEFLKEAIVYLRANYRIDFVTFQDDLFVGDKKRFYEFCEIRNRYFPEIYWSCTGRANICDEELISTARASGCTLISYGFESGSPKMLKSMQKRITLEQMEKVVQLNRKYGLPVPVSFILGMPGEDEQTCTETVQFCKKNNLTLESLMYATPYPGTPLFEFAIQSGRINKNRIHDFVMLLGDARDLVVNLTDTFTDKELQEKYQEMISVTKEVYRPLARSELEKRIRELYGALSDEFFNLSCEEREHRSRHGAIGLF
jgi:radical SAM superfamily enzyme YgiQ (UPF0313 family)